MRPAASLVVIILLLALGLTSPLAAAGSGMNDSCVRTSRAQDQLVGYDKIQLVPQGFPADRVEAVGLGMAKWNDSQCNSGSAFPRFQTSSTGAGRTITLVWNTGLNPENNHSCGGFSGNVVNIYSEVRNPNRNNQIESCGGNSILAQTIAHELGHVLGLEDLTASQSLNTCRSYIMAGRTYTDSGLLRSRDVQDSECEVVGCTNMTPTEAELEAPGSDPTEVPNDPNCTDGCSPIVIDLQGNGFELTGLGDSVAFDIDADGLAEELSWTRRGVDDSFLVLDRDANGRIDNGTELFGSSTSQPPTDAPNGFLALAVFDAPAKGGDGDGLITERDAIYPHLRLWRDSDHSGTNEPGELVSLPEVGIRAIALDYVESRRRDRYGNEFRWAGRVFYGHGSRLSAVDIIFLSE